MDGDWGSDDDDCDMEGFDYLTISGHPDWFYNSDYYYVDMWNGYPHLSDGMGAHLYYLNTDSNPDGYWQLDNREQDGTNDWYDGGYMWCPEGMDDCGNDYDDFGFAVQSYSVGDIYFQLHLKEEIDISGHSDWFYNGEYYRGDDWNGYPHFENSNGAHLYYLYSCYWQLDNRVQDGTSDLYDGGYMSSCDDQLTNNMWGYETAAWSNGDTLYFEHSMGDYISAVGKSETYSTFAIMSYSIMAMAILMGIRQILKKRDTKAHRESLVNV